jgi:enoyl-CoA hydratase
MAKHDDPAVRIDIRGHVGWITVSNPRRKNAITPAMCQMLEAITEGLACREDVRAVVVRGEGPDAFISGADITMLGPDSNAVTGTLRGIHGLARLAVPVIAMINGPCYGGGIAVALDADIRIASSAARFAIPAARLGAGYGLAETAALVRAVGAGEASAILFGGAEFDAQTALRIGLVQEVVAHDDLTGRVTELASRIASNAPLSLRAAKAAIRVADRAADSAVDGAASDEARAQAERLIGVCAVSADFAEGRAAFLAKRTPTFSGR